MKKCCICLMSFVIRGIWTAFDWENHTYCNYVMRNVKYVNGHDIDTLKHQHFVILHALYVHCIRTHTQQLCLPAHTHTTLFLFLRSISLLRDFFCHSIVWFVRVERRRIEDLFFLSLSLQFDTFCTWTSKRVWFS